MLKLGITSPIIEIQKRGLDPQEVVKDFVKWNNLCQENGLYFNYEGDQAPLDVVQQTNDEANNGKE